MSCGITHQSQSCYDKEMTFDHVAIPANNIAASVEWYREHFAAEVLYQDATWAFLNVGGQKLALVTPTQHPPHVAIRVSETQLAAAARQAGRQIDRHRDGTTGIYLHDPFGNAVELICYPPGQTVYDKQDG
jgi:catechol 2,3-dioxygenase-like lactoylglutathione lyase family enzyme